MTRRFWILLAILFVLRLAYTGVVPLDLSGDETYYWDWGCRPAWGYLSKPPLIAWLMALVSWVDGGTTFSIRATALLLGTGTLIFCHALARRLYGERAAFWTAAAMAAAPGNAASNLVLTIDAPLLFFWCAALCLLWRAVSEVRLRIVWSALLVAVVGLGMLSKQMMLVFPVLALLFFASDASLRQHLRRPWFWLGLAASLAFLAPVIVWNGRHQWMTFHHTAHHFSFGTVSPLKVAGRFLVFVGSQMGVVSPVLWVLMATLLLAVLPTFRALGRSERFLLLFSGPPLMVMTLMTLFQRVNANWTAAFYPAGFVLLAGWAAGHPDLAGVRPNWRRFFLPGVGVGAALSLVVYSLPFVLPATSLSGGAADPLARVRGWHELGREVGDILAGMPEPERTFIVTVGHRYTTSQLAFYTPGRPPVYRWNDDRPVETQYELWPGPESHAGWDALVVVPGEDAGLPPVLSMAFERSASARHLRISLGPEAARLYTVYPMFGLESWPAAAAAGTVE